MKNTNKQTDAEKMLMKDLMILDQIFEIAAKKQRIRKLEFMFWSMATIATLSIIINLINYL